MKAKYCFPETLCHVIISVSSKNYEKKATMHYELVYSTDFTQTPLYKAIVTFVGECAGVISTGLQVRCVK